MRKFNVNVNGKNYQVEVDEIGAEYAAPAPVQSAPAPVAVAAKPAAPAPAGGTAVNSPMPGTVLDIKVKNGEAIKKNQVILILEAMKMENEITAPADGIVTVAVSKGATIETGTLLATLA